MTTPRAQFLADAIRFTYDYRAASDDIRRDELVEEMTAAVMRFVDAEDAARIKGTLNEVHHG